MNHHRMRAPWQLILAVAVLCQTSEGHEAAPLVVEIQVEGLRHIETRRVLEKIQTRTGQPFRADRWDADWRTLRATGWFKHIRMVPAIGASRGRIRLIIRVVEANAES